LIYPNTMTTHTTHTTHTTYPIEILTPRECNLLLGAPSPRTPTGSRNRALIATLWRSGLRISEALALRPVDVDLEQPSIRVLHGKGDKARTSGIDFQACKFIKCWLKHRAELLTAGPSDPLFCTLAGGTMKASYVRALLKRLAHRAGVVKRVHPHAFRHSHAAELRVEGKDIGVISKQLGHGSIATTSRYLDHVAPVAVIEAIRGREW